jgi:quercetin dioxygenase-like cupin family protein
MADDYHFVEDLASLLPEIADDSIVSRTYHEDDRAKSILFGFAEGQELSEHTASQPAVLYFLHGDCQLTLGEESFEAKPGTWVHMRAKLSHSVLAKTPSLMLLMLFKEPS